MKLTEGTAKARLVQVIETTVNEGDAETGYREVRYFHMPDGSFVVKADMFEMIEIYERLERQRLRIEECQEAVSKLTKLTENGIPESIEAKVLTDHDALMLHSIFEGLKKLKAAADLPVGENLPNNAAFAYGTVLFGFATEDHEWLAKFSKRVEELAG